MTGLPGNPPRAERGRGFGGRFFRIRVWLYVCVLAFILLYRYIPSVRSHVPTFGNPVSPSRSVVVAGLDLAPVLIPRLTEEFRKQYPSVDFRLRGGGCRQALEDLINHGAELAFLNRLPTADEHHAISSAGDSVETYPIALGGIGVLSASAGGIDSVTQTVVEGWFRGERSPGSAVPSKIYVPDPNLGLWDALASQLGVKEGQPSGVVWLSDERAVAQAVAADPNSVGFASMLSMPPDLDRLGARLVKVRGDSTNTAVLPVPAEIANGDYPLFHYLYLACTPKVGGIASGFVTFYYSPRGQRLVEREGFLPARESARIVQLVQKPLG